MDAGITVTACICRRRKTVSISWGCLTYMPIHTFWEIFEALKSDLELKGIKKVCRIVQNGNICDLNTSHREHNLAR